MSGTQLHPVRGIEAFEQLLELERVGVGGTFMLGAPTWRRRWRGLESQSCPRGLLARNQRVVLLDFSKIRLILLLDNPESGQADIGQIGLQQKYTRC